MHIFIHSKSPWRPQSNFRMKQVKEEIVLSVKTKGYTYNGLIINSSMGKSLGKPCMVWYKIKLAMQIPLPVL